MNFHQNSMTATVWQFVSTQEEKSKWEYTDIKHLYSQVPVLFVRRYTACLLLSFRICFLCCHLEAVIFS